MEEPVTFDVYAKAFEPYADFLRLMAATNAYESQLKVRVAANNALNLGDFSLIGKHLSWTQAQSLLAEVATRSATKLMQAGYFPSKTLQYCVTHDFYYGGCLGCHVCNNFFTK